LVLDRSETQHSEVFIVVLEPNEAPPLHKHDNTEQIFYILEGKGILTIKGESTISVNVGDIIRIPKGYFHSIIAINNTTLKYLAVDCFSSDRNKDEKTWDDHVKLLCKEQGWDYDNVKKQNKIYQNSKVTK
jgi:mannose-6-phosphate isomerase-like protein (cupin superfamily)